VPNSSFMSSLRLYKRSTNVFLVGVIVSFIYFYSSHEEVRESPIFLPSPFRTITKTVTHTVFTENALTTLCSRPAKPKLEKHTYRLDGLLEVNPNGPHPIYELIREAERKWEQKLQSASKTLVDAVHEYRRRYNRNPPKGFDIWYVLRMELFYHFQ
jgi:hypothetical protein